MLLLSESKMFFWSLLLVMVFHFCHCVINQYKASGFTGLFNNKDKAQIQVLFSIWMDPYFARQGIIIECSLNLLFHDLVTVIVTSRTVISEMVDNDNDNELPLAVNKR